MFLIKVYICLTKRQSAKITIQSQTMSIGILHATGAEQINFEAEDGDWILLQSDGVPDCLEDSCRLLSLMGRRPRYDVRAESRRREGKQPAKRRSLGSDCENQKNIGGKWEKQRKTGRERDNKQKDTKQVTKTGNFNISGLSSLPSG